MHKLRKYKFGIFVAVMLLAVIFYSCSKDEVSEVTPSNDPFKHAMLVNYADNVIIPAYTEFQTNFLSAEIKIEAFLNNPTQVALDSVKPFFKNAYLSYEKTCVANFGPASTPNILFAGRLNSFPVAADRIESSIQSDTYNFTISPSSDSIQGLSALDYLLFSANSVQKFSDANAALRKKYVRAIITQAKSILTNTISQWNNSYKENFINSLQTNLGSSIGYLVNQFAFEMDVMKGPRIGWPFGKQSNGQIFAQNCEAYHSSITGELAVENIISLKKYYTGGSGKGIDDYLILLKNEALNNNVLTQFDVVINALKAIPDPMSNAFTNNTATVENAYREVQTLLTMLKTDVAAATAVQISYMDNDGD